MSLSHNTVLLVCVIDIVVDHRQPDPVSDKYMTYGLLEGSGGLSLLSYIYVGNFYMRCLRCRNVEFSFAADHDFEWYKYVGNLYTA
jgi:hypothetical protein